MSGSNGHVDLADLPIERRMRALRVALGLKQTELAEELGMNVRQIKRWESGALPSEESAWVISDAVARLKEEHRAPRRLKVRPELLFEPRERRDERLLALERRVDGLERRLRKAGI